MCKVEQHGGVVFNTVTSQQGGPRFESTGRLGDFSCGLCVFCVWVFRQWWGCW